MSRFKAMPMVAIFLSNLDSILLSFHLAPSYIKLFFNYSDVLLVFESAKLFKIRLRFIFYEIF
jgi:hypothetical protein